MADADRSAPSALAGEPPDDTAEPVSTAPPALLRTAATALYAKIAKEPWAFSFYQAMRRLEAAWPDRPRFGHSNRLAQDPVRLAQEPSVIFAPATLADWQPGEADLPARLLVHFFGLFGPDGPLPLHLTEYARDRRRDRKSVV